MTTPLKDRIKSDPSQFIGAPEGNRFYLCHTMVQVTKFDRRAQYVVVAVDAETKKVVRKFPMLTHEGELVTVRHPEGKELVLSTRGKWPQPKAPIWLYSWGV